MPSKMVTDREKAARAVEAAATILAADVTRSYTQLFTPLLAEGEVLPDFMFLQELHHRLLRLQRQQVVTADVAHTQALLAEGAALRQRDEAAQLLYDTIIEVRALLESHFGRGVAEGLLALDPGIVASDPQRLQRFARDAIALMTVPGFALPPARIPGEAPTPGGLVGLFLPPLEALEATLEEVEPAKRASQRTRKVKSETLVALDESIALSARWLEAHFARAGERYHAERVRRSSHRKRPVPPTDAELDATDPPADGKAGEGDGAKPSAEGGDEASSLDAPPADQAPQPPVQAAAPAAAGKAA